MDDIVDEAGSTRDSERLDESRLSEYLSRELDRFDGPLTVRQFRQGHSNLTYLISDGVGEWVLRRPPFGTVVKSAHDMGREYRILSGLHDEYSPAPRALLYCDDDTVIGAPFFVMERIRGVIIRSKPPRGMIIDEELARQLCESLIDNLTRIHGVDLEGAGLANLGKPHGYIGRQVTGWTKRYDAAKTDDIPQMESISAWLAEKTPNESNACLIHNDYKFDNTVFAPDDLTRIIGVLDWEMSTIGHPLMDLGTSLSYWIEAEDPSELQMLRMLPTNLPGMFTRRQLVDRYAELTNTDVSAIDFFRVFGLFKTAVVAQQIYYRFKTGKTNDPRFQMMIVGVTILSKAAELVIKRSGL